MGKIIAVTNQKGGVGKTTSSINLAASLAEKACKVLLVDLDPQGNATMGSGVNKKHLTRTINDVLLGDVAIKNILQETGGKFNLAPANSDLTAAEIKLLERSNRERQLSNALAPIKHEYNYIIIDCPPSLNMLTLNALVAADSVIIPVQCEYYALEGLTGLLDTIKSIKDSVNENLAVEGLLRTMYDSRNRLTIEVSDQLMTYFGEQVFATVIPRNVRLAEAPSHGLPALLYDKSSLGARAYLDLAKEMLGRKNKKFLTEGVAAAF